MNPLRPLKLLTTPAEPPVTANEAQFHVPVHAPLPQLMATRCAPLATAMLDLAPVKLMFYVFIDSSEWERMGKGEETYGNLHASSGGAHGLGVALADTLVSVLTQEM